MPGGMVVTVSVGMGTWTSLCADFFLKFVQTFKIMVMESYIVDCITTVIEAWSILLQVILEVTHDVAWSSQW